MKRFILILGLIIGVASYSVIEAQSVRVNINISRQPAWGPVGYDYVGYYYFPDIDCYYDVNAGVFYYMDRGLWVSAHYLPYAYRNYDLYRLHKVVLNVAQPWRCHRNHYQYYAKYRGHHNQIVIRDSRDYRYHKSRDNRVVWYSNNHRSNGRSDYRYNGGSRNSRVEKNNNNRPDTQNQIRRESSQNRTFNNQPSYNGRTSNTTSNRDRSAIRSNNSIKSEFAQNRRK